MNRLRILFLLVILSIGCREPSGKRFSSEEIRQIAKSINESRVEKDKYFLTSESPLSDSLKSLFHGLDYYSFDSAYVFSVRLERYDKPREVDMITSKGKIKHYIEYGYFEFDLNGPRKLNVYRPQPAIEGHDDYLFVPFMDDTNGKDTYAAGRYLELTLHESDTAYILDFNAAYNPWCNYSDNYNCPHPPDGNRLSTSIYAGERLFKIKAHI